MGNIKLLQGHKRNPENHLSWLGEIPALFSLCVTHAWNMRRKRQEKEAWHPEWSWAGAVPARAPSEPEVSPWKCTKGCIHRNTRLRMNTRKVLICSHLTLHVNSAWPLPKVTVWVDGGGENKFFPSLLHPHLLSSELTCLSNGKTLASWIDHNNQRKIVFKKMRGSPPS